MARRQRNKQEKAEQITLTENQSLINELQDVDAEMPEQPGQVLERAIFLEAQAVTVPRGDGTYEYICFDKHAEIEDPVLIEKLHNLNLPESIIAFE